MFLRRILGKEIMSTVLKKALPMIDYFCFWNYEDYLLLQKKYKTNIKFKYFTYQAKYRGDDLNNIVSFQPVSKKKMILINHQASVSANHLTVVNRIAKLDTLNEYKKLVPLSYGFDSIRKLVIKKCSKVFHEQFIPLLSYMPKEEYFKLICDSSVAIIGSKRQEAAGNIIFLLKSGVKVFLRNDNNLLAYYRKRGYIIFSFEDDLNTLMIYHLYRLKSKNIIINVLVKIKFFMMILCHR